MEINVLINNTLTHKSMNIELVVDGSTQKLFIVLIKLVRDF